ncbi:hypothetical protein MWMV17_MWMV17_03151 [Acinetobacter calcoaceticus]|uniref:DUF445 domain-containing protein n=2 Tax=Acinetobacter calcoaceticus TaxID=471 RepID=A0ABP2UCI2_ACICA|nr:hypothetical protein F936_03362 [Acinetobacter calcoaceticus DSM 30006 = CIP 81.8]CAI3158418.1 hypothetical protein MWMV17_MWMV17_03151 [Acinetobacter calcoaceticus]SUU51815.1 Protein of uncharacterised function (DUF445) [Acinetobacter calcoaceticus]
MLQTMIADFQQHFWLYISIPFMSGLIGYITKVIAIQMMFSPLEFKGIKPFLGWQGIVPRKAEKMATIAVELMTAKLIKPEEIFARLDPKRIAKEIEKPLLAAAEDITRDVAQEYQPGLWEGMPEFARQRLIRRVQSKAPEIVEHIMGEVQRDVNRYFDIKHLVISNLLKDKRLLNNIFKRVGKQEFKFFSNVGFFFGFGIGVIQMFCWIVTQGKYPWMLPMFGGFVGFFSDWIALQMMFRPLYPKKIFGYTWQGLFIKRQNEVAADYAALISKQLLTSRHMMEELFSGTHSDRVIDLVNRHVKQEIDMQAGVIRPLVVYAIGGEKYQNMKSQVAERIMQRLPETMKYVESYAEDAMNIRSTLIERMQKLTPSEFEGMLRPAFKEDEWSLIAVGAVLGFVVGELQIQFML